MSNNKTIFSNTLFLYTRLIFILFVSLYTSRVVLNVLGVIDYGIYNVVAGFVSMFAFLNTSMINSVQRFYNYEKGIGNINGVKAVYNMAVRIQLFIGVITVLLLEFIGVWYINNVMVIPVERLSAANWVFQFSVFSLFLVIFQIPYSSAVVSHEKMNFYAFVGICDAVFKLIIAILLPYASCDSLIIYSLLMFLISIMNFLLYYIYAKCNFEEIRLERGFHKPLFVKIASFSGWNIFDAAAFIIQGQGVNLLMNSFFGPIVNASRGIAYQIQSTIYNFSSNLATAFKPQLVESFAQQDYKRTTTMFYSMSKACFFMQYVLSIPVLLELDYILMIWLGHNIPAYATSFTRLVLVNTILNCFNMPMSQTVQATGRIRSYQVIRSFVLMSVLPISYLVLRFYEIPQSVFYVIIFLTIILQPLSLYLLGRVFQLDYKDYLLKVIFPSSIFAVITLIPPVILSYFMTSGFLKLILTVIIVVITSIVMAWLVLLSKSEKSMLKSYIITRLRKAN